MSKMQRTPPFNNAEAKTFPSLPGFREMDTTDFIVGLTTVFSSFFLKF